MIVYSVSSLMESDADVVLHGVNARGKFGAGVAKAMADVWPRAKADYLAAFAAGTIRLGAVIWSEIGSGRVVGHMVTQENYGRIPGKVYVDYRAVEACMRKVAAVASEGIPGTALTAGFGSIAMPRIGSGLAGGDWRRIEEIVERQCGRLNVTVHVMSPAEIPEWRRVPAPNP